MNNENISVNRRLYETYTRLNITKQNEIICIAPIVATEKNYVFPHIYLYRNVTTQASNVRNRKNMENKMTAQSFTKSMVKTHKC